MSPKQERGFETADRLVAAALDEYARHGTFTVQSVTGASGVSLGSLYHHFGSLDGLCAALYSRCMGELLDSLAEAVVRRRSAQVGVRALVVAYLRFARDRTAAARFIHSSAYASFLPAHAETIIAAKAPALKPIVDWFRPYVASGEVVDLPEALLEPLLLGPPAEVTRRWLAGAPGIDLAVAERLLPERVWQAVRAA